MYFATIAKWAVWAGGGRQVNSAEAAASHVWYHTDAMNSNRPQSTTTPDPNLPPPLLPLDADQARLETVGGKGANLAILRRNGLPVPAGFFVPVSVYRQFVADNGLDDAIADALTATSTDDPAGLEAASQRIRQWFQQTPLSNDLIAALDAGWASLGRPPVAVRSSATAEDLPGLSFAGQQDTYLNVIGGDALQEAVRACWGSLWTARAISYRLRNAIPHQQVGMAVIVQKMVDARASGVMFTANPVTGLRGEIVIEATLGLGEALVSGQVTPDRYIVSPDDRLQEKTLGEKARVSRPAAGGGIELVQEDAAGVQALPDDRILQLARLGRRIEALYHFPQDIEWALSTAGDIAILQSRPITSLYPLPDRLPDAPLSVMLGLHVVQGVMEPFTPLGLDVITHVLLGLGRIAGWTPDYQHQTYVLAAGERVWGNITGLLRHPKLRERYTAVLKFIDPVAAGRIGELLQDPRLAPGSSHLSAHAILHLAGFIIPFVGRTLFALCCPGRAYRRLDRYLNQQVQRVQSRADAADEAAGWERFERRVALLDELEPLFPDVIFPRAVAPIVAGLGPFFGILRRMGEETGHPQLYLEIARGLPHNVTTEMDLALWRTAQAIRSDPASMQLFSSLNADALAQRYQAGELPDAAQQAVNAFMARYGMRGPGEIDIGRPRWREQPAPVFQTLLSYLTITDSDQAPDAVFARGARAAQQAADQLAADVRVQKSGRMKAALVRWAVRRYRTLGGLREAPKFTVIRIFGIVRQALLASGQELVADGQLSRPDDLFFLDMEALQDIARQQAVSPAHRDVIRRKRETRAVEMRRQRLPRLLLSDGRAFYDELPPSDEAGAGLLTGEPVSPGVVEGPARVLFDPHTTQLQPGEILVCPGTDPAWTPLFLSAGGLVMEVGGMMTHGAVVAREYGIPAVVGVHQATGRIQTGQRLRVDGSSGRVQILDESEAGE